MAPVPLGIIMIQSITPNPNAIQKTPLAVLGGKWR